MKKLIQFGDPVGWFHRLWGSVHSSPGQADDFLTSPGETEKAPTGGPGAPWYKRAALWLREHDGGFTPVLEDSRRTVVHLTELAYYPEGELPELPPPGKNDIVALWSSVPATDPLAERRRVAEELLKKLQ